MDEREKAIRESYGHEVFEECICTAERRHFDECNAAYLLKLLDESRAERDECDRALQSLTPGGSEFVRDSKRCVDYVRWTMQRQLEVLKKFKRERDEARERQRRDVESMRQAIRLHDDNQCCSGVYGLAERLAEREKEGE